MVVVDNLVDFNILETYINGKLVFTDNKSKIETSPVTPINNFNCNEINVEDIAVKHKDSDIKVIVAEDGSLLTNYEIVKPKVENGLIVSDMSRDILKIVVINRYRQAKPVVGFIKNFNLKKGAIAGSIAHDSHNIIAVGVDDADIVNAINTVISAKGAIVALSGSEVLKLELPIAGLMSNKDAYWVAERYKSLNKKVKEWGSSLHSPFMTLSFMALLVIPELKIGDLSLFDVKKFEPTELFN